jgi:hypothetical protein
MTTVVAFLGAHWKGLFLGAGGVVLGAYLGRLTAPKPICPPPPPCPELHCAAQVDAGVQSQADCNSKVVIKYLFTDAGCPEPTVTVDTSGHGDSSAHTDASAASSAVQAPEVHVAPIYVPGPSWEVGGGVGVTLEGRLAVPVGVRWYPHGGTLGLGLEGDVRPHDVKQSSVGLSVTGRW